MASSGNSDADFSAAAEDTLLSDLLRAGRLPPEAALRYAVEIGAALDELHLRGEVHGSLSPDAIALTASGVRLLPPRHGDPGAAAYRSPEQVRGQAPDARSDVFAYGAILYELSTGMRAFPFEGAALNAAILETAPPPVSASNPLHDVASEVIASCLEKRVLVRRQRVKNAVVELELRSGNARREARRIRPPGATRGAVIEFPQAVAPPSAPLPIQAALVSPAAPVTPRLDHFLIPPAEWTPEPPPFSWWQRLGSAFTAPRLRLRVWVVCGVAGLLVVSAVAGAGFLRSRPQSIPLRFTVPAPSPSSYPATPALSPDGQSMVFTAIGAEGRRMLWRQSLTGEPATPLPGTEEARYPFWSPDGRFVAYFDGKSLLRISIAGGAPQVICATDADPGGGSWNRDGKILFAPNTRGGLSLVSAEGGTPERVLPLNDQTLELAFLWPQFLPDGKHFLFFALKTPEGSSGIHVGSLGSDEHFLELPSETNAVFAASAGDRSGRRGRLLFMRGRTLLQQPFDSQKRRIAGEPAILAEDVEAVRSLSLAPVAASGTGSVVYQTLEDPSRELVWMDRTGAALARVQPGDWGAPRLAPDGTRAVAARLNPDLQSADLWIVHRDGRSDRLTETEGHRGAPVWSPDGSRIAFVWRRAEGVNEVAVQAASAAGRPQMLLRNPLAKYLSDWSADGRLLLFQSNSADPRSQIDLWAMDAASPAAAAPVLQTVSSESYAALSPDGQWLAYQSDETGRNEVYVQAFHRMPELSPRRWRISRGGGALPRWRGDGRELYYVTPGGRLMAAAVQSAGGPFESDTPRPLFQTAVIPKSWNLYDVSRDGLRFLFNLPMEWPAGGAFTVISNWSGE